MSEEKINPENPAEENTPEENTAEKKPSEISEAAVSDSAAEERAEKLPAAPRLLKDDPGTARPRPKQPSRRKKEAEAEKERRERQERIELLKMKQGLIEESEIIPETGYVEIPKLTGWNKFTNFLYFNKIWIIMIIFFAIVAGICIYQFVTKEKYDVYAVVISSKPKSEISWRLKEIEAALEMYCEDFDGNGKVNVAVKYINRPNDDITTEFDIAEAQKLTVELVYGEGQLMISEETLLERLNPDADEIDNHGFVDFSDKCEEDALYMGCGIRVNRTGFAEAAHWNKCPDDVCIFLRTLPGYGSAGAEKMEKSHEASLKLVNNILESNIVNPPKK